MFGADIPFRVGQRLALFGAQDLGNAASDASTRLEGLEIQFGKIVFIELF
jgi:hypothetical protein